MKRNKLKLIMFLATIQVSCLVAAAPENFSVTKSCDGAISLIRDEKPLRENFYVSIYQQAYVQDGLVLSENHTFTLPVFLGSPDTYKARKRVSGDHVIYDGPKFLLAIPWKNDASLEFLDLSDKSIPGPQFSVNANLRWQVLCKAVESSSSSSSATKLNK